VAAQSEAAGSAAHPELEDPTRAAAAVFSRRRPARKFRNQFIGRDYSPKKLFRPP